MAARLGNVIYWTCCGVSALWLAATIAGVYYVVSDDRGPFAAEARWEYTFSADQQPLPPGWTEVPRATRPPACLWCPTGGKPPKGTYIVSAPASMTAEEVNREVYDSSESRPFRGPTNAELEAWLASHSSVGFNSDWWRDPLFLGLVPALLMWLFGRACRYVLAGT